jgi:eukaryotic-like serine/threonine-protein kinase
MTSLDIDTRSDIYALGVLLYELLTGRTPFDSGALLHSGLDEMRRTIREIDPERPSTRLSEMGQADLTHVAQRRKSDAPKLIHLLRGDLDWIVMKALEKDRTRRFETASALAADIQRHLNNETVSARPPTNFYRFQKLVRRNKTAFAAVGAVAAALVIGLGLSLFLFVREREAHRRALAAEKEQARLRQMAEASLALEAQMRRDGEIGMQYSKAGLLLAQGRFEEAETLVNQAPAHAAAASIFSVLGNSHGNHQRWREAVTNYSKVVSVLPDDVGAYHYLAPLLVQIGDVEKYRGLCREIIRHFGATNNPVVAERSAKDCLILPPSESDLPAIAKMTDTAIAAGADHRFWTHFQFVKGFAEYRQAHFSSAAEWLQKVVGQTGDMYRTVQAHMVLAMTQQKLNQPEAARATLASGIDLADRRFPKAGRASLDQQWNDWIIAHALIREARALIEGTAGN